MEILYHDDDNQVELGSSVTQFNKFLSVDNGERSIPLEYDEINYISCDKVDSSPAIINIDADNFIYPDGHVVTAKTKLQGDDGDTMSILMHDDTNSVKQYSSIDQFSTFLSDYRGGVNIPIEFDEIDYISCDKVESHPIIVDNGENIGYIFSDGEHEYITDEYPLFQREEDVLKELPPEYGDGFYQAHEKYDSITNFDNDEALGIRNRNRLRIGQHYYLADEILPADDPE